MEKEWERRLRLAKATKFAEAGRAAGHEIQARVRWGGSQQQQQRGNRRSGSGVKRREQAAPTTAKEFIASGGMERLERRAAFHAAKEAIQLEREFWLGRLQGWLRTVDRDYARGADYVRLTLEGRAPRQDPRTRPPTSRGDQEFRQLKPAGNPPAGQFTSELCLSTA